MGDELDYLTDEMLIESGDYEDYQDWLEHVDTQGGDYNG